MTTNAGYNSPQSMFKVTRAFFCAVVLLGSFSAFSAEPQWDAPVAELSAKIVAISGPGTASLQVTNSSSVPNSELGNIRRKFQAQLKSGGIEIRDAGNATFGIKITLSESRKDWLWIAEVQQGTETRVAMVSVPRSTAPIKANTASITLQRNLILNSRDELLDVATIRAGGDRFVVALSPSAIKLYKQAGMNTELQQSFAIDHPPFPRDVRGRLVPDRNDLFKAYLPGIFCRSSNESPNIVKCQANDDAWPIGSRAALYNSARNYFSGALVPGTDKPLPPFYTIAELPRPNYTLLLFASVDGTVSTYDGMRQSVLAGNPHWGSDLTAIRTQCGIGTQILASEAGETDKGDALHIYEIADREAVEVGAPLQFDGEIVALWPSSEPGAATVITRKEGGSYDAFSVTAVCSH